MKKGAYFFVASTIFLVACASKLSSSLSREEALRLYNGEILEAAWIGKLDTISRSLPFDNLKSVQLADGFLFYESEVRDGEIRVVNVLPPPDAPESLKNLAKSLRKNLPLPKKLFIDSEVLRLDGVRIAEKDLRILAADIRKLPAWKRPCWQISVSPKTLASELARLTKIFDENGLETQIAYVSGALKNSK